MSHLLWDDVRNFFDPDLMGALPDLSVAGTSVEDWQAVFDLIRSSGWAWEYVEGGVAGALPLAAEVLTRPADAETAALRVRPAPGEIDFDVDLRELQGQEGVDVLCRLLAVVGRRLGKPVVMTAGGDYGNPVLGFDPTADRVVLMADPQLV